jgi:molybdate transport system substrate-binding protein
MKTSLLTIVCVGLLSSHFSSASAAEISVLALAGTKEAVEELIPAFEKQSGNKLTMTFLGSVDIRKKIAADEAYDLIITAHPDLEDFIKQGKVSEKSTVDLMKTGIGIAVRQGLPKPNVSTADALKASLLSAKAVAYSTGLSGTYIEAMLKKMGIFDQLQGKLKQAPPSVAVGSILVSGDADIGFQQIPEIFEFPGVTYVGPLPPELQNTTQFAAGISSKAKAPEAAHKFIEFLASREAAGAIQRHGMEPG